MTYTDDRKRKAAADRARKKGKSLPVYTETKKIVPKIKGLFLDDERLPHEVTWKRYGEVDWKIVKTPHEFQTALKEKSYDLYSLDWYLGTGQPLTGMDMLIHLCEHLVTSGITEDNIPTVVCHSAKDDKAREMDEYWLRFEHIRWFM